MASETAEDVLFPGIDVWVERVSDASGVLVVEAVSTARPGRCPDCRKLPILLLMGAQQPLDRHAVDCVTTICLAAHLSGQIRDVNDDARAGQLSFAEAELRAFGVAPADLGRATSTPQVRELIRFQTDRAAQLCAEGRTKLDTLAQPARRDAATMLAMTEATITRIRQADHDVLARNVTIGRTRKLAIAASAFLRPRA
ncbi:hypothetical protein BFF78_00640 [Streptomyces fodineus]|uniref:Uncharacterized protein n=1 Tax=Streptomyces fodineus TaxID=1904616 RepID=A0A1D7Y2I8_9ACTN|nr:squalene/phytoene synthase family protein [Streptomyces fodineus]AOR29794.1 hypothetical protein BFF78_00640 [Streptomyces fodineus]